MSPSFAPGPDGAGDVVVTDIGVGDVGMCVDADVAVVGFEFESAVSCSQNLFVFLTSIEEGDGRCVFLPKSNSYKGGDSEIT